MSILAGMNFDANTVDPAVGFAPIPEGIYVCMVESAQEKPTKDGSGIYLEVAMKIIEGASTGRKFFHRFNLQNRNPQAVQIARGELSAFCRATGIMTPKAAHEFANRTLRVGLRVEARHDDKTKLTNTVSKFEATGSVVAGLVQNGTSAAAQPAAPAGAAPWARA